MSRRIARVGVVQVLFMMAHTEDYSLKVMEDFLALPGEPEEWESLKPLFYEKNRLKELSENQRFTEDEEEFIRRRVPETIEKLEIVDQMIQKNLRNWRIDRLALLDRSILRVATFELLFDEEIPSAVSVNEAVNIAKYYSTADSSKFINGILSSIIVDIEEPDEADTSQ